MARKLRTPKTTAATARRSFAAVEADLNTILLEREDEVRSVLLALLCQQHLFQLGLPGVGKSLLADAAGRRFEGVAKFEILMGKFTSPEEVFGPPSLRALREDDRYVRNPTGMLQTAQLAFIDEIWKANSAVLNTLLPILNERVYREAGSAISVPLMSMVCASNELPQGDDLGALYDRILFRHVVPVLSDAGVRQLLLNPPSLDGNHPVISSEALVVAQAAVKAVKLTEATVDSILRLRGKLAGVKGVYVSPRRWRACLSAIQATAWLAGRSETEDQDLLVLAHCLWADPDHIAVVEVAVIDVAVPALRGVRELLDLAVEQAEAYRGTGDEDTRVEALMKLKALVGKVSGRAATAGTHGVRIAAKVEALYQETFDAEQRRFADRYGASDLFEEVS